MKKYRTRSDDIKIKKVEILRETESSIFIATTYGKKKEQREAKCSSYSQYHDTWEAAHEYLLKKGQEWIANARQRLDEEIETLQQIEAMKPEKAPDEIPATHDAKIDIW